MADTDRELLELAVPEKEPPMCSDHDNECPLVKDKLKCWLYAPEHGYCPYLRRETP